MQNTHFRAEVERLRDSLEDIDHMLEHGLIQLLFMAVDPALKADVIRTFEAARGAIEDALKQNELME
ncbi:hypothetical protein ACFCP7_10550 [Paenibacillus elgii]